MALSAIALAAIALVAALWPKVVAWPLGLLAAWSAAALLVRARRLHRAASPPPDESADARR